MQIVASPADASRCSGTVSRSPTRPVSLEALFRDHYKAVCRWVRYLGVEPEEVEDVAQQVFLVIHGKLPGFRVHTSTRSWIFSFARGVVANHRRGRERHRRKLAEIGRHGGANSAGTDDRLAARAEMAWIEACLAAMDEKHRIVLVLTDIEGMTAPEIAEVLKVRLPTVYTRLRTARRTFLQAWKRESEQRDGTPRT